MHFFGITKEDMESSKKAKPYLRVLGLDDKGKDLLSKLSKSNPKIPVITSVKDFYKNSNNRVLNNMLNIDILATDIYTLEYLNDSQSNLDYTQKIVTLPKPEDYIKEDYIK